MAAIVSWYGPLIDLAAAASHVGGFVQLLGSVRSVTHHQEQNATTGRTYDKTIFEVGDDTRSSFSVSVWSSKHTSTIIAGDILLLQNIKIVEFRNGLEGRGSQISAVQVLLNSEALTNLEGIGELVSSCKVGDATRSKLRRVAEWTLRTKCALKESPSGKSSWTTRFSLTGSLGPGIRAVVTLVDYFPIVELNIMVISKNWKEATEKESTDAWSISELLCQSKLCNINVYASIGKMVLANSPTSHFKGQMSVLDKHSLKEHNDIVRDFITTGCKLCGLPLYQRNINGENTSAIDCPNNPKYLHALGQIYKPFMMCIYDQSGQVPLLVRNKAAEILFANIVADDVSECFKSHQCMLLETCESGNVSPSEKIDCTGNNGIATRRKTEQKPNFHLIWLIMIECLLGKNSPFCFQISVNPEKHVEDGRFELLSLTMSIP